ncbi:MAG: class I SAM-dependent methyltransferase [Spirochaetaceae bacterium]
MAEIPETLTDVLARLDAGRTLEVGCGDGEFTEQLVETLGSFESIEAVDILDDVVEEARRYFEKAHSGHPVTFRRADAAVLPFAAESFDTVVVSNTLHHLPEPVRVMEEVLRVLRAGGRLLVNEMVSDPGDPAAQVGRDLHHLKAWVDRTQGISHHPTLSRGSLHTLLRTLRLMLRERLEYTPPAPEPEEQDFEAQLARIDDYAEHAAGHPDYPAIRKEVSRLRHRVRAVGAAPAPQVLLVLEKRTESYAGDRRHA